MYIIYIYIIEHIYIYICIEDIAKVRVPNVVTNASCKHYLFRPLTCYDMLKIVSIGWRF